ncbi:MULTISPECIES: LD-carboxypeptidase [unclassified Luteimonas]|uniref:S66 peptidase family protein n=1 Tax=unclassified Luteimonas TaxID=2629088 RepID=UPI0015FF279C|nr:MULTISPECIES: LD-carboxypeptidase [unclassified Luteimonas]MBB1471695.1 LD-carboxypeptidase [Luteimonas sp. MC1782]MBB6599564.1 LD-carboxypeptidase [Luteimonas sp. MC1825]QOC87257.1 LD-carboxypeptidase [Luteimonas sp. MC1825]
MHRRHFLGTAALAGLLLPLAGTGKAIAAPASGASRLLPVALNRGDTVALVSPSSQVDDGFNLQLAREVMEALGFKVKAGANYAARRGHLAGSDAARADDLNVAFADGDIKAVICVRGGSGAARLLPLLDYDVIRANPKALLGYSDITALHSAIHAKTGLVTFHGPNGSGSWNSFNADQFRRLFLKRELMHYRNVDEAGDELVQRTNRSVTITGGKARGELVGGNLAVLTALAGSPYLPDFKGRILFLEDVEEAPYRVDRMFSTLKLMGALDQIAGFVFGECTDCNPGDGYGSLTLQEILDDYIRPLGIPAYRGAMIGHIRRQFILPVGGRVELDADAGSFRLLDPVFQA